jgi:hypothetical protein
LGKEIVLNLVKSPDGFRDEIFADENDSFSNIENYLRAKYRINGPIYFRSVDDRHNAIEIDSAKRVGDVLGGDGEKTVWWSDEPTYGEKP